MEFDTHKINFSSVTVLKRAFSKRTERCLWITRTLCEWEVYAVK